VERQITWRQRLCPAKGTISLLTGKFAASSKLVNNLTNAVGGPWAY
jgi:hypothetical protein